MKDFNTQMKDWNKGGKRGSCKRPLTRRTNINCNI